jgi:hypothetical protein
MLLYWWRSMRWKNAPPFSTHCRKRLRNAVIDNERNSSSTIPKSFASFAADAVQELVGWRRNGRDAPTQLAGNIQPATAGGQNLQIREMTQQGRTSEAQLASPCSPKLAC